MTLELIGRRTPMERAPEPDLGFEIIPAERYTSAEFMRLEWERMWTKVWLMVGRESDLPEPGDYFTAEVGPESILVRSRMRTPLRVSLIWAGGGWAAPQVMIAAKRRSVPN